MAAIPPEHGGDRDFIENAQSATNADAIGDLAASLQLVMQALQLTHEVPVAMRDALAAARPRVDTARQAVEAIQLRDVNQRRPPPLTHVPDGGFGALPFGATRFNHIQKFVVEEGRKPPATEVYSWLSACSVTATTAQLNDNGFYTLLMSTSGGEAFRYVEGCFRRNLPISEAVRSLEGRYGNLETPAEAGLSLTAYERNPKKSVASTLDDIRILAAIHLRTLPEDERDARIEELVQIHLLRVTAGEVAAALTEEIRRAILSGAKVPTNDDLANRADRLEARKESAQRHTRDRERHQARQVQETYMAPSKANSHQVSVRSLREAEAQEAAEELIRAQPMDTGDEIENEIIERVLAIQQVMVAKNVQATPQSMISAAIRQVNKRRMPVNQVLGQEQTAPQGPPNKLARYTTLMELLRIANVNKGECLACGLPGHIKGNVNCALRGLPLMDIPCTRCGKGLHSADSCPKPYMNPNAVNACEEESLNES